MFLNSLSAGPSSDPAHDFWFQPAGMSGSTLSGSIVTADSAMRLSTVYKCIKVIAETIGMLPMHMYRAGFGESRDRVRDDPIARLLSTKPNDWQTPMQFRSMLEAHRSMRGNGYAEIIYGRSGTPEALVPLHPDRVTPEVGANGLPRYRVKDATGTNERVLVPGEILHLAGLSLDGYVGINPIQAEREAIGSAIAARDYGSRFWNNDARPPFWIKVPGSFKDNDQRSDFRSQWQAMYGGSNRGRPAVLDRDMSIQELGISNTDAQWIDSRKYSDVDLCGLWRVPPHKIGILDRATWGNIEQQNMEFVSDCLLPLAVSWEQTIARDLIIDENLFVEMLLEILLRGDTTTRYSAYGKGIQDGWLTRNEVRRLENRNPLAGLDEPLQPLNMTGAGAANLLPDAPRRPGRAAALLAASADRVVRKEVRILQAMSKQGASLPDAFADHARFVADVMAVSAETANAYLVATLQRAQILQDAGKLKSLEIQDWTTTQIAALLQLEG
ncbi:MAG: phage portal protein [Sphingomonadaceae bacterium]